MFTLQQEQAGSVFASGKRYRRGGIESCAEAEDKPSVRRADTSRASVPGPGLRLER